MERGDGERRWREEMERGDGERRWREEMERGDGERWVDGPDRGHVEGIEKGCT
jgi:hypothetical protein